MTTRCRITPLELRLRVRILKNRNTGRAGICHCLPPDRTWRKVNDPKVDYSGGLGERKVGHEPRLEPCLTMRCQWCSSSTRRWPSRSRNLTASSLPFLDSARTSGWAVFADRPSNQTSVLQCLFLGGSERRAVAQTHPAAPKRPRVLPEFP